VRKMPIITKKLISEIETLPEKQAAIFCEMIFKMIESYKEALWNVLPEEEATEDEIAVLNEGKNQYIAGEYESFDIKDWI